MNHSIENCPAITSGGAVLCCIKGSCTDSSFFSTFSSPSTGVFSFSSSVFSSSSSLSSDSSLVVSFFAPTFFFIFFFCFSPFPLQFSPLLHHFPLTPHLLCLSLLQRSSSSSSSAFPSASSLSSWQSLPPPPASA